jgi:hypothetical protein
VSSQIVPLQNANNQAFTVQLTVNGAALTLGVTLAYSEMAGYWMLSIFNSAGVLLLSNLPLITGWWPSSNILAQYQYLNIGSLFLLNTGNAFSDFPGQNNLASFSLLWDDNS